MTDNFKLHFKKLDPEKKLYKKSPPPPNLSTFAVEQLD